MDVDVSIENIIKLETVQKDEIIEHNKIKLVEKHIIKPTHELYKAIDDLCFKCRMLRNKANFIIRQNFFSTKNHKFLDYNFIDKLFKRHEDLEVLYRNIPRATIAQQCLRQLNTEWTSFFKSVKAYDKDPSKYTGRPKPPKYKKNKDTYIAILLPQEFEQTDKYIEFPNYLNNYKISYCNKGKLKQVRFIPCSNKVYKIELVFECELIDVLADNDRYLCIDLGVDNFATITTNVGTYPILLNGKGLKSINQYYNKTMSDKKSILPFYKNGKQHSTSKLIERLYTNRNNKISSYMHTLSRFVVEYAETNNINTIIIGYNKGWKQYSNMNKVSNQNFQQISFLTFVQQIEYKAKLKGISVERITEAYSSGTSFLDKEPLTKKYYNKSRRIKRGLFKTNTGILINADVNASYQIMKKYLQKLNKSYVIEDLQNMLSNNIFYALSPVKVSVNCNTSVSQLITFIKNLY